jgi:hypothetical protein
MFFRFITMDNGKRIIKCDLTVNWMKILYRKTITFEKNKNHA